MTIIKYDKRKKRIFSLFMVFLFLIISSFFFNQFVNDKTIFQFWNELLLALLEEKWTLICFTLEFMVMLIIYAKRNSITLDKFFPHILEKLWGKEDVTNIIERLKWYLVTNAIIVLLVFFTYLANPLVFIYHLQFTVVLEGYMLADFLGIIIFRIRNEDF